MNLFSYTFVELWSFRPKPRSPGIKVASPGIKVGSKRTKHINLSRIYFQKIYWSFFTSTANASRKWQTRQQCTCTCNFSGESIFSPGETVQGRRFLFPGFIVSRFLGAFYAILRVHLDSCFPYIARVP